MIMSENDSDMLPPLKSLILKWELLAQWLYNQYFFFSIAHADNLQVKINDRLHFYNSKRSFICQDFLFVYIISFYKSEAPDFHRPSHMYILE